MPQLGAFVKTPVLCDAEGLSVDRKGAEFSQK
jgi:hypothetical protein